jgi:hypothetical protein
MAQLNVFSDVSAIANNVQEDATFVLRKTAVVQNLVETFRDMSGGNPRVGYAYSSGSVQTVAETDDLASQAFTPSADQTLTPIEIGLQFFIGDLRAESSGNLPESVLTDAARELGFAAADQVEDHIVSDLASLTGGTIGAAGTAITWGYMSAAISVARNINKTALKPLVSVIHGFQAELLASAANIAGASLAQAPGFTEQMTRQGGGAALFATFAGVPIWQVYADPDGSDDFTGGVFPREALALDWRRPIRIRGERDESRRGIELNMSAVYAHGVWKPERGVQMIFDATAPSS